MPLTIPSELKKITQFIRRAEELDRDKSNPESRIVAFYCRQYAVQQGIPMIGSSAAAKECLGSILNDLETEKKAMSNFTKDEAKLISRKFADKIFDKANSQDVAGAADKNTARTFYAAAVFFEILQQFHAPLDDGEKTPDQAEEDEKRIYSKWKATEILKALREGRAPTPGGYKKEAEEEEEVATDTSPSTIEEESDVDTKLPPVMEKVEEENEEQPMEMPPSNGFGFTSPPLPPPTADIEEEGTEINIDGTTPPPPYPVGSVHNESNDENEVFVPPPFQPPLPKPDIQPPSIQKPPAMNSPPATAPSPATAPPSAPPKTKSTSMFGFGKKSNKSGGKVSKAALADAKELTRFALAALDDKDTDLAAERLKQALQSLGH